MSLASVCEKQGKGVIRILRRTSLLVLCVVTILSLIIGVLEILAIRVVALRPTRAAISRKLD